MPGNETVGIAGHVKDAHSGLARRELFGEGPAVYSGHDDIGEQEIKVDSGTGGDFQRFFPATRGQNAKSGSFQKALGQFA